MNDLAIFEEDSADHSSIRRIAPVWATTFEPIVHLSAAELFGFAATPSPVPMVGSRRAPCRSLGGALADAARHLAGRDVRMFFPARVSDLVPASAVPELALDMRSARLPLSEVILELVVPGARPFPRQELETVIRRLADAQIPCAVRVERSMAISVLAGLDERPQYLTVELPTAPATRRSTWSDLAVFADGSRRASIQLVVDGLAGYDDLRRAFDAGITLVRGAVFGPRQDPPTGLGVTRRALVLAATAPRRRPGPRGLACAGLFELEERVQRTAAALAEDPDARDLSGLAGWLQRLDAALDELRQARRSAAAAAGARAAAEARLGMSVAEALGGLRPPRFADLDRWATASEAAIEDGRGATHSLARAEERRRDLIEALRRDETALFRELEKRAVERGLPPHWPASFFSDA